MANGGTDRPHLTDHWINGKRCYRARLSKDGMRVLCGLLTCRGVLGDISESLRDLAAEDPSLKAMIERQPDSARTFVLGPGWERGADSVYRLIRYAQQRYDRGQRVKYRRAPARLGPRENVHEPPEIELRQVKLPAVVECPRCHRLNELDADVLRVSPLQRSAPSGAGNAVPLKRIRGIFDPVE